MAAPSTTAIVSVAPATIHAQRSLSLVLLGATGRTGIPFLYRALERGHHVTAYMRNAGKLPADLAQHPLLTCVEGQLYDEAKFAAAYAAAKPHVIVSMLASDQKPYTGWSSAAKLLTQVATANAPLTVAVTANSASLSANAAAPAESTGTQLVAGSPNVIVKPPQTVAISAWGCGGKSESIVQSRWTGRAIMWLARTFIGKTVADMEAGIHALEDARRNGTLRVTFIQPALITNGPRTDKYECASEDTDISQRMTSFDTISRHDLADLTIRLIEQAGEGHELPHYVPVRNP